MPLRLFLDWGATDLVGANWAEEFDDKFGMEEKEQGILKACSFIVQDIDEDSLLATVLDICADNGRVVGEEAYEWGDETALENTFKCKYQMAMLVS